MDIKKEKGVNHEVDAEEVDEGVEIIRLDLESDAREEDPKSLKAETPKTAKDLFSDFKPDSGSEQEPEEDSEGDDDDDEPLAKRIKKESPKSGTKKLKKENDGTSRTPNNKKVV